MERHTHLNKAEINGILTGDHSWGRQKLADVNNRAYGGCQDCRASLEEAQRERRANQAFQAQARRY
jgi:hypothetical protein